jgi:hypothetical protein
VALTTHPIYCWSWRKSNAIPLLPLWAFVASFRVNFTLLYFTLLYFTLLYFTLLYFTVLHFTLLYFTLLYFTLLYFTVLYFTVLYFTLLYFTLLYFTVLYFTLLYFTLLYFTLLYFTLLYFTLLYFTLLYDKLLYHERNIDPWEHFSGKSCIVWSIRYDIGKFCSDFPENTYLIFLYMHYKLCHRATAHLQLNIVLL